MNSMFRFFAFFLVVLASAAALPAQEARLANLATRGQTGTGASILSAGFVIGPGPNKQVIIRAIGPSLSAFGLTGLLADPFLTLFNNTTGVTLATNDSWQASDAAVMASVGAFALPAGSKDAVIVTTLPPGAYSAQVSGVGGTTGLAIVEIYEVGGTGAKLVNISTRGPVGTGQNQMFPGIVVNPGTGNRKFLVRAVGPTLGAFGLTGLLADPTIIVTNSTGTLTYASNNDWGTPVGLRAASTAQLNKSSLPPVAASSNPATPPPSPRASLTSPLAASSSPAAPSPPASSSAAPAAKTSSSAPSAPR